MELNELYSLKSGDILRYGSIQVKLLEIIDGKVLKLKSLDEKETEYILDWDYVHVSISKIEKKRYWQWKVEADDVWCRISVYMDEKGYNTFGDRVWDLKEYNHIKFEDDYVEV
jgi:hypothetical protein